MVRSLFLKGERGKVSCMEINGAEYRVVYDDETKTVFFEGSLRLQGMSEYVPIGDVLDKVGDQKPAIMTLNLQELKFLNSSGINLLSRFVIKMRKQGGTQLVILGASRHPWQNKSLKNLERLMPGLQLEIE